VAQVVEDLSVSVSSMLLMAQKDNRRLKNMNINYRKYYVYMFEYGKMRPAETILRMRERGDKGE
jgi:hypothetical protein